jgi:hypothetical protein
MVPDVFGGMNEDVKLEPLPADAELESGERMAKDKAKQANSGTRRHLLYLAGCRE